MNRRSALKIAGGLAAAAALAPRRSVAAAPPKRLVVVFSPDGTIPQAWRPTGSQTDFQLGPILAPFEPYKKDLLVIDGVRRLTRGSGDGHEQGMTQMLTGRPNLAGATRSTGPSVDEFVNLHIGEGRQALRLGVRSQSYASNWTRMTFGENGNVLHPESNPYKARDTVFGGFTPPSPTGPTGPSPAELRAQAIRKAVLGYAKTHTSRLATSVADLNKPDLLAHAKALESLQNEPAIGAGAVSAACSLDRVKAWTDGLNVTANDSFPKVAQMQTELISAAFACDRARVAVLQCSMSNSEVYWTFAPVSGPASAEHHGLSHYEFGNADPLRTATLVNIYRWHAQLIAGLVGDLKAKGLFDNTVVLWVSDMGEGKSHSPDNIPMVVLGSGGGYFKTGQWVDYRNKPGQFIPGMPGVSHSDVLTSICQSMGIQTDKFGDPGSSYGPLKGVT